MRSTSSSASRAVLALLLIAGCGESKPSAPPPPSDPRISEARRLLAEAGFPDGKGFPELEIITNDAEWHKKIAAAIQEWWRIRLGIKVSIRNMEWKVYLDLVQ